MSESITATENKAEELETRIEMVAKEISEIKRKGFEIRGGTTLESFERELHKKHSELADLEAAKIIQEKLYSEELSTEGKELAKSHPKKNEG